MPKKAKNTIALIFYPGTFHFNKKTNSISQNMQSFHATLRNLKNKSTDGQCVKAKKLQPIWLICEIAKTQAQKANFKIQNSK